MAKKEKRNVVYSTNPNFQFEYEEEEAQESIAPEDQLLYVSIDTKQGGGKEVTLVEGFVGPEDELKDLGKILKSKCGVGGAAKNGEILIQGNFKTKVADILQNQGFKVKLKGGS